MPAKHGWYKGDSGRRKNRQEGATGQAGVCASLERGLMDAAIRLHLEPSNPDLGHTAQFGSVSAI